MMMTTTFPSSVVSISVVKAIIILILLGEDGYEEMYIHTFKGWFDGVKQKLIQRRKRHEI